MSKLIIFFFLISSISAFSTVKSVEKVDDLLKLSDYFVERNYLKTLLYANKAVYLSEKSGDSEKTAWSYFYAAKALASLNKNEESLKYINKVFEDDEIIQNPVLYCGLKLLRACIYSRLGMKNLVLSECNEIIEIIENEHSIEAKLIHSKALYAIAVTTDDVKLVDYYFDQSFKIIKHIPQKQRSSVRRLFIFDSYLYNARGMIYLERKKMDSAKYYLMKAYSQSFIQDVTPKNTFLVSIGDYYKETGDDKKALFYYLKSLANIDKYDKIAFVKDGAGLLKEIYTIYGKLGDTKNEKIYLERYYKAQNDFGNNLNDHVLYTVNKVLNEKVTEHAETKKKHNFTVMIIGTSVLIFLVALFFFYKQDQRRKNIIIKHKQGMLHLKEKETIFLSSKIDSAINQVVDAGKNNRPEFWALFQKVHPEFTRILSTLNPDLKTSELILCAYIFLGFNTKDVAEYTFKAVQTVKNNKHNLRKRLGLPPKQDMTVWIRNIYNDNSINLM